MNSKRSYLDYFEDILDAIEKAEEFIGGMDFNAFAKDEKTKFAVIRALEIIGEASKHVPVELKEKYSNLPWREMAGIRDKLIHEYFGVNDQVVWKTALEDLPKLKAPVMNIIEQLKRE